MNKYNIFLIFFFLFFLIFSFFTRYSYADTPTPTDTPNCHTEGGSCDDPDTCCWSQGYECVPGVAADHGATCQKCTQGQDQSCSPGSKTDNECCTSGLTCVTQSSGNAICTTILIPPTINIQNPCATGTGGKIASCPTAIGDIPVDVSGFVQKLFQVILSLSGGVALLMIIYAGYRMSLSQGNPEKVQQSREILTSAIVGLMFIILSVTILQIIGVDILGLGKGGELFFGK